MRISFFLIFGILLTVLCQEALAQKKNYIILYDSIYRDGKIQNLPTNELTEISFRRSNKEEWRRYGIDEISEFQYHGRLFYRKEIPVDGVLKKVFLEKLPNAVPNATIWKVNTEPASYLLETTDGMQTLGSDYQKVLLEKFGKPEIKPLLDFTQLEDIPLTYLNKTARTLVAPRTFTHYLVFTPHVGVSSQQVGFSLPDADLDEKVGGLAPVLGFSGEVFLDFPRRFSFSTGVLWSQFDSQEFFTYSNSSSRFESDIYMDFSLIQIPILVRYYHDLKPNRMRIFVELGYMYGIANFKKSGIFQAELIGNQEVITSRRPLEMGREFDGMTFGIGLEKYLSTYRGLSLGLRNSSLGGTNDSSIQNLTFYIGYKF